VLEKFIVAVGAALVKITWLVAECRPTIKITIVNSILFIKMYFTVHPVGEDVSPKSELVNIQI
jgi:hypothetical protein